MVDWLMGEGIDIFLDSILPFIVSIGMTIFTALRDFFFSLLDKSFDVVSNWLNI